MSSAAQSESLYLVDSLLALKRVAVGALILLALVAFALGFYPLEESARRAGIGIPILLPVLVDLGLVLMGLGAMAARANRLRSWPMRLMTGVLILVSSAVQYFHAIAQPNVQIVDIVVAVMPPLVLWSASSAAEMLIFGRTVEDAVAKAEVAEAKKAARTAQPPTAAKTKKTVSKSSTAPLVQVEAKAPAPEVSAPVASIATPTSAAAAEERPQPSGRRAAPVSPDSEPKPATAKSPGKASPIDEAKAMEAARRVVGGESLYSVAKEYGIGRSALGRRVEKARAELNAV